MNINLGGKSETRSITFGHSLLDKTRAKASVQVCDSSSFSIMEIALVFHFTSHVKTHSPSFKFTNILISVQIFHYTVCINA